MNVKAENQGLLMKNLMRLVVAGSFIAIATNTFMIIGRA